MSVDDPVRLLLLADDFTGACDAAAPFAGTRSTFVTLSHETPVEAAVTAIDLDLREVASDDEASDAITEVLRRLPQPERVYLKIDSTLRGPVAGLIRGALAGSDKPVAVIAPAFPEQGRLYTNGRLAIGQTVGASLIDLLGFERTALLGATFTRTPDEVERAVAHAQMRGALRIVVDVDRAASLASVATAAQAHPEWLLVGSAGLTRHLASAGNRASRPLSPQYSVLNTGRTRRARAGPIVVVAGSPQPATHAQIDRLPDLPDVVVVRTAPSTVRDQGQIAAQLADEVQRLAATLRPAALILAGGATGRSVCQRLQAHAVHLLGEWSPGIPVGELVGGPWDGVLTITKAGGFGGPHALLDVLRALGVSSKSD